MDLKAKVLQSLRWSVFGKLVGQAFSWAVTLVVMRILTPDDYGVMALASATASFLFFVNELGLVAGLVQSAELTDRLVREAYFLVLVVSVVCFAILFSAAVPLAEFYGQPQLESVAKVLSLQFLVFMFGVVPSALLMRAMRFKELSVLDLAGQLAGAVVTLGLAISGHGVWSLVWGQLASMGTKSFLYRWVSPPPGLPIFPGKDVLALLAFSSLITVQRFLWFLYTRADVFIVGKQLGQTLLGQYSVAFNLASLPMQKVNGLISAVLFPAYSSVQGSVDLVRSHLAKTVRLLSVVAFPVFFGISAVTPEAVTGILGEKWTPAILPMQLLCLVMPLRMLLTPIQTALNSTGHAGLVAANVGVAALCIPTAIFVGARWGLSGVAVAWLVSFPLVLGLALVWSRRSFGFGFTLLAESTWRPALGAMVMYGMVYWARVALPGASEIFNLVALISVGVVTYASMAVLFSRDELAELRGFARVS